MNWLFDQPIYVAIIGVFLTLLLAAAWLTSGRKELMWATGLAVLLTVVMLIVERVVVTDQEAIRAMLAELAADVESNNVGRVTNHIWSGAPSLVGRAESEMPNYKFTECRITKLHSIEVTGDKEPRNATVEFNVIASGTFRHGGFEVTDTVPRWVRLHLVQEQDGRWAVRDYEHDAPQRMILNQPTPMQGP